MKADSVDVRYSNYESIFPIFSYLKPYKKAILGALTALLFTSGIMLSIGQGLRLVIDKGFSTGSPELLNQSIIVFMILVVCMSVGVFARYFLVSWIGERVSADIRKAVFDHVVELDASFFEANLSGEIQTRITTDTTLLQTVIGSSVSVALRNILMFFGGFLFLFITNAKLAAIVLCSIPLAVGPVVIFGQRVRVLSKKSQDRIANAGAYIGETLRSIKVVKAFNHQEQDKEVFAKHVENTFSTAVSHIQQRAWLISIVILMVLGAVGMMLWVGGHDVLNGELSGGELAAFVFYAIIVSGSVGAISEVIGELQRAAGAADRLLQLLKVERAIPAGGNLSVHSALIKDSGLTLDAVNFSYASRIEDKALSNVSLDIQPGETFALVGHSGAGKSTLFDLVMRFYLPQSGKILIGGVDINLLTQEELSELIAMVPQSPVMFTGDIKSNIAYGKPKASFDEIVLASKAAFSHDFIMSLPDGYETHLGESGVGLSGGQKQRIAIARAILCRPKVLLLDEATSSLDAESEQFVQKALDVLMKEVTCIVIAHRLVTVRNADRIAVLHEGAIESVGSHNALRKNSPIYERLANLQFSSDELV